MVGGILVRAGIVVAIGWALAGTAAAQIQQLPATSRGEAQSNAINNSLAVQGQNRAAEQQNQFEINSLRNGASRTVTPPPVVIAPPIAGARP